MFAWPLPELTSHSQRTRDPEYAAMMDAQPKPKGRGRKKVAYMSLHRASDL
jgi:SWI/SNF-related matrix-associated actin-dependent regulator of chromatin subfamily A member 5